MESTYARRIPTLQNIDQRFRGTRAISVGAPRSFHKLASSAVAVDLDEAAADGQHHWSGIWYVVRGPDGWLLDQLRGTSSEAHS